MLGEFEVEDGSPVGFFVRRCGFFGREGFEVLTGEVVVLEAFVGIFESVVDTAHYEVEPKSPVDRSVIVSLSLDLCVVCTYSNVAVLLISGSLLCIAKGASAISSATAGRLCI